MGATARPELSIDRRMVQHAVAEFELSYGHRPQLGAAPSGVGHDVVGGAEWPILAGGARCDAGDPLYRYTGAVGLLVPREDAFDARRTSAVFVGGDVEVSIELPRDLRRLAGWRGSLLDGDRYQHRVALRVVSGAYELLEHFCADDGRGHAPPGHHGWGDSGHESNDLAYSLLCVRYGARFKPGWRFSDRTVPAMLFPGLFGVIARLSRGA